MVSPSKMPSISLPPLVMRKIFGQRPGGFVGLQPLDGARRQDQHAVRGFAAQHLLPGERHHIELGEIEFLRESRRGGVADGQALAVGSDPVGILDAHTGGGAVPGEHHVAGFRIDLREVRQLAIIGRCDAGVVELELLGHIRDPAFAEAFPGEHLDRAGSEHRPQRHLDRAGIGGGHDADAVIGRNLQDFAGQVDGALQARLAELRPVRAAQRVGFEIFERPSGALRAGAGGKKRRARTRCGQIGHGYPSFQMVAPRWGGVSRCRICRMQATRQDQRCSNSVAGILRNRNTKCRLCCGMVAFDWHNMC